MALAALFAVSCSNQTQNTEAEPQEKAPVAYSKGEGDLRIAVAGLAHGHLGEVCRRVDKGYFELVGASDENDSIRANNGLVSLLPAEKFYKSLEEMLDATKPEAVVAYGSTYDHLRVVEACAPRGIHVMVEKPLCTDMEQAAKIKALADRYGILVLTNYETSWYPANTYIKNSVDAGRYGKIFRIEIYDGHQGPVEIGCDKKFLDWLTDPVLNGAGALFDFGCYGADIATWIFGGKEPVRVTAALKTQKPAVYPKVDDDAAILVEYDDAVVEINASWCWPFNRKDMRVYGLDGSVYQMNGGKMVMEQAGKTVEEFETEPLAAPYDDSFRYLKAAVRGEITVVPSDLAALESNITVVKILDAARRSAQTGKAVEL